MKIKRKYNRMKILLSTNISSFIELVFSATSKLYDSLGTILSPLSTHII